MRYLGWNGRWSWRAEPLARSPTVASSKARPPMPFVLHPRIDADTVFVADLPLSTVRLMRNAQYPWLILVPRRPDLAELIDLPADEQHQLTDEIAHVSTVLKAETGCLKLNVAALGNIVRQLHIHVIARNEGDAAWPAPVWGPHAPQAYAPDALDRLVKSLAPRLARW